MDGFLSRLVSDERQRIGKPKQRRGGITFIEKPDAVGDVEPDDAVTVLSVQPRILGREAAGFAGLNPLVEERQSSNDRDRCHQYPGTSDDPEPPLHGAHPTDRFSALE